MTNALLQAIMKASRTIKDIEQWNQSSGSKVIPRRARPGLAGLSPHIIRCVTNALLQAIVMVGSYSRLIDFCIAQL